MAIDWWLGKSCRRGYERRKSCIHQVRWRCLPPPGWVTYNSESAHKEQKHNLQEISGHNRLNWTNLMQFGEVMNVVDVIHREQLLVGELSIGQRWTCRLHGLEASTRLLDARWQVRGCSDGASVLRADGLVA